MKQLAGYLKQFAKEINRTSFVIVTAYTAVMVWFNYYFNLEKAILKSGFGLLSFASFFFLYLAVFGGSYFIVFLLRKSSVAKTAQFTPGTYYRPADALPTYNAPDRYHAQPDVFFGFLLLVTTCFFAWRVSSGSATRFLPVGNGADSTRYWAFILRPPLKFAVLMLMIEVVRRLGKYHAPVSGLLKQNPSLKPFLVLLICFVPVIMIIGSQPDFLISYPRVKVVDKLLPHNYRSWIPDMLFELSYAFDFLTAEVFFRGLLVLAFVRYAGAAAILPMASFYCAIHFGKPLVECISSYAGAIMLGVITYRTGSVIGGLVLHLGIGWLMELVAVVYNRLT